MFSVKGDKCAACLQHKCLACIVQCSMCSMKRTGADAGAFAGADAVCSVHCAVCSVLPAKYEVLAVETG